MWVSCQAPFRIRAEVARLLDLPESRVRVIAPDVGGGFGVKTGPYREDVLLAWLARRLARPVKWVATRREDQATTNQARGSVCEGELALDAGGRITGLRARIASPLGSSLMNAAAGSPWNHARLLPGAYVVPACDITVSGAVTTTAPVAAYRGAGPAGGLLLHRAADGHRGARARAGSRRAAPAQPHPAGALPVPHRHRAELRLGRLSPGARTGRSRPPTTRGCGARRRSAARAARSWAWGSCPTSSPARSAGRAGPFASSGRGASPPSPARAPTARGTRPRSRRWWPTTWASRRTR